ncbi:MAG: alanine--tRNA ligase, partial [Clostridia bacterium]|nr:alanine--tRNA ligase [Clostridia bacterium]
NIDTGMGLERLACVMQGVNNLFEVDTIRNIMLKVCEMAGVTYEASGSDKDVSLRVITDHIRTATFLISDGVLPSNEGRGYILRRVLRRAARHGKLLGIEGPFLSELCDTVIHESGEAYPELVSRQDYIRKIIRLEEDRFRQTLDAGLGILDKMIKEASAAGKTSLEGKDIFKLYDTFGFPVDLTREITAEKGLSIDEDAFRALMQEQKTRAREARAALGDVSWEDGSLGGIDKTRPTEFVGYEALKADAEIINIIKDNEPISVLSGGKAVLVLDKTPFYAEMGGQVADWGAIRTSSGEFNVTNVKKTAEGVYLHSGELTCGEIALGACEAEIDRSRRQAIMRNHSSVHLLQAALRKVLGTHVQQAGSYVDEQRGRFDFSHPSAMTTEEILQVEDLVNESILNGLPVETDLMSQSEAIASGAMALFGEKYGETVRVVRMGDVSKELCGGTHVANTAQIGMFRILSESSVAAGVRRIESATGFGSLQLARADEEKLNGLENALKANGYEDALHRAEALQAEVKTLRKSLENMQLEGMLNELAAQADSAKQVGKVKLLTGSFKGLPMDTMRAALDRLTSGHGDLVVLLASENDGKVQLACGCGKDALAAGAHCGNLLKRISPLVGGGGGGRPDNATSGGKNPAGLPDAFAEAEKALSEIPG